MTGRAAFHSPSRLDRHRYRILRAVSCYHSVMVRSPHHTPQLFVTVLLLGMQCWGTCAHMSGWRLPLEETRNEKAPPCHWTPDQQNHPSEERCIPNTVMLRSADSGSELANKTVPFHADNALNTALDWISSAPQAGWAARLSGPLPYSSLQSHSTVLRI